MYIPTHSITNLHDVLQKEQIRAGPISDLWIICIPRKQPVRSIAPVFVRATSDRWELFRFVTRGTVRTLPVAASASQRRRPAWVMGCLATDTTTTASSRHRAVHRHRGGGPGRPGIVTSGLMIQSLCHRCCRPHRYPNTADSLTDYATKVLRTLHT